MTAGCIRRHGMTGGILTAASASWDRPEGPGSGGLALDEDTCGKGRGR